MVFALKTFLHGILYRVRFHRIMDIIVSLVTFPIFYGKTGYFAFIFSSTIISKLILDDLYVGKICCLNNHYGHIIWFRNNFKLYDTIMA